MLKLYNQCLNCSTYFERMLLFTWTPTKCYCLSLPNQFDMSIAMLKYVLKIPLIKSLKFSGFGHLAPETWQGKLFCIFYSLLGVPINGILIGSLGTFFGSKVSVCVEKAGVDVMNKFKNSTALQH